MFADTYYAIVHVGDAIPNQDEWYGDIDSAETDAIDMATDDNVDLEIYEINFKRVRVSERSVVMRRT